MNGLDLEFAALTGCADEMETRRGVYFVATLLGAADTGAGCGSDALGSVPHAAGGALVVGHSVVDTDAAAAAAADIAVAGIDAGLVTDFQAADTGLQGIGMSCAAPTEVVDRALVVAVNTEAHHIVPVRVPRLSTSPAHPSRAQIRQTAHS